jgi:hypothetical protein
MASLASILNDPNYVNANEATKQAIFEKFASQDPDFTGANTATQDAIRQKFGVMAMPAPAMPRYAARPDACAAYEHRPTSVGVCSTYDQRCRYNFRWYSRHCCRNAAWPCWYGYRRRRWCGVRLRHDGRRLASGRRSAWLSQPVTAGPLACRANIRARHT